MTTTSPGRTALPAPPRPAAERDRRLGLALCLATIVLAVLDQNIVSAATVPIVRDLAPARGIDQVPWLISAYALAATAALPLYGKLCDVLGPKRVFLGAIAVFLAGSALCGAAQDMGQLIAFRALQGLGGGGLMSVTMVVLAVLKGGGPREKPGGGSGIGGIVAGAGMALGPLLGGALAQHAGWRWIFYVNLPVGLAVLVVAARVLHLPHRGSGPGPRIDYLGAALGAALSTGLLLVSEWGGKQYGWTSPVVLGLCGGCAAVLGLFLWRQATAAEPILPLGLFRIRTLRIGFAVQGLVGMALTGSVVYVLVYLQVARGIGATSAGLFLLPMAFGMTAAGLLTDRLARSHRSTVISGAACATLAMLALATTRTGTDLWLLRAELLLLGLGFGQIVGKLIQLVQFAAPEGRLGVATTAVRYFQTLGGALGAAAFGTVLSRVFAATADGAGAPDGLVPLRGGAAFVGATDVVFLCAAALMALAFLLALRLPLSTPRPSGSSSRRSPRP